MTPYGHQLDGCKDVEQLRRLHARIRNTGLESDRFLANQLVKMYGRLGSLKDARSVFETIRHPNSYSWNIIISAYITNGEVHQARALLDTMPHKTVVASNALLTGYMDVGYVDKAESLFTSMPDKDVVSWTAMVTGYARNGHLQDASRVFENMPERNLISWNSMISAYAQNGHVLAAEKLFKKTPEKDLVSWTAMVTAYAAKGQGEDALQTFRLMDLNGFPADKLALAAVIDACTCLHTGRALHEEVGSSAETDVVVGTSLVKMYGKCFRVELAEDVFAQMAVKNILSWNTMLVSYAQNGRGRSAVHLFRVMNLQGLRPNQFTFASFFDACTTSGDLAEARRITHACLEQELCMATLDVAVGTSLVNLYGKSSSLPESKRAFDGIQVKNVQSVTAMVAAYSQAGCSTQALQVFRGLAVEGMEPDRIAFVTGLSSCSVAGLLTEGWEMFVSMKQDFGVLPGADHYLCMIDLLGRAGKLEDAVELINTMPFEPDSVSWTSLLAGCATQNDVNTRTSAAAGALTTLESGSYQLLVR